MRYREYMRSDEWRFRRDVIRQRAKGLCEFCGQPMAAVHHVRYPKGFPDDDPATLVAVCEGCHQRIHGVRTMLEITGDFRPLTVATLDGGELTFHVYDGKIWATVEKYTKALDTPWWLEYLKHRAPFISEQLESEDNEPYRGRYQGREVYRWAVIRTCLRAWEREWLREQGASPTHRFLPFQRIEERRAHKPQTREQRLCQRIDAIDRWGWKLEEQALLAAVSPQTQPAPVVPTEEANFLLQYVAAHLGPPIESRFERVEGDVREVKAVVVSLTAKQGFRPDHRSVRMRAAELGLRLTTEELKTAGGRVRSAGISPAGRFWEGTFEVNQYSPDQFAALDRALLEYARSIGK